jgi:hypothetical protein
LADVVLTRDLSQHLLPSLIKSSHSGRKSKKDDGCHESNTIQKESSIQREEEPLGKGSLKRRAAGKSRKIRNKRKGRKKERIKARVKGDATRTSGQQEKHLLCPFRP